MPWSKKVLWVCRFFWPMLHKPRKSYENEKQAKEAFLYKAGVWFFTIFAVYCLSCIVFS